MLLQGWKQVSDLEYLDLNLVERDFCSPRQDDVHAQQEAVTEGRVS